MRRTLATLAGCGALWIWSAGTLFMYKVHHLPPMEILALSFGMSTLFFVVALRRNFFRLLCVSWKFWVLGFAGIFLNSAFFAHAFHHAPPLQVELIFYLWPIFTVIFESIRTKRVVLTQYAAVCIGFLGVAAVFFNSNIELTWKYLPGDIFALAAALLLGGYNVISKATRNVPHGIVGLYSFVTFVSALIAHLILETTVLPGVQDWSILAGMGVLTSGIAYYLWDIGMKKGRMHLLGLIAYGNPMISSILLVLFAGVAFNASLLEGTFLIILATFVATRSERHDATSTR